jgi:thioredoxin 1
METIAKVNDGTFAREVLDVEGPVLVKLSTAWCPPCRALEPHVAAVAREYAGRLKVVAVDAEDAPQVATRFAVRAFPTVVLVKNGREVARQVGAVPKARLVALLEGHV